MIGHPELEREVRQWIANNTDVGGCEGVTAELLEHLLGIVNGLELDVQDYQRRLGATNTAWIEQSRKLVAALEQAERVEKALVEIHDTMSVDAWGIADAALAAKAAPPAPPSPLEKAGVREFGELCRWTPEFLAPGFKGYYYEDGDETAPFMTEAYLYNLLGKEDARTLLALARQLAEALGTNLRAALAATPGEDEQIPTDEERIERDASVLDGLVLQWLRDWRLSGPLTEATHDLSDRFRVALTARPKAMS